MRRCAACPFARCGNDLIALGEALQAFEQVISGDSVDVNVGISVGFRRGDSEFAEGLFMCLRINDEEIVLDELNTSDAADVGSDHYTREYDRLSSGGSLDAWAVEQWLAKLAEVQRFSERNWQRIATIVNSGIFSAPVCYPAAARKNPSPQAIGRRDHSFAGPHQGPPRSGFGPAFVLPAI